MVGGGMSAIEAENAQLKEALADVRRAIMRVEHIINPPERWGAWFPWDGSNVYGPALDRDFEVDVEVQRRDPRSDHFIFAEAHHLDWAHTNSAHDILFFREKLVGQRPYKPAKEESA